MSSNSTDDNDCAADDNLCRVRTHDQAVIIVPTLLLLASLVTLLALCLVRLCPGRSRQRSTAPQRYSSSSRTQTQRHGRGHQLQGIDAPPGINPLEHEELPMSVQQGRQTHNHKPVTQTRAAVPQITTEGPNGAFSRVTVLPLTFSVQPDETISLYRARKDNKDVVLRVLRETANSSEKQHFLGFASFVSGLGPHPFIPALIGAVSVQSPVMMVVVEELQHRDLLGFLWRCRQDNSNFDTSCDMTEKRIFTMAGQVASALEYLHSQRCIHGNVGARSVLVGGDLTAKLWGLGSAYRRSAQTNLQGEEAVDMRKWQAPEVLSRRAVSQSSDVWSFGILIYEMVTLGDPPFAQLMATEILQYLQRGKHLKRPVNCSNSMFSIIRSCCQWSPQQRLSMSGLIRKLQAGEKSANGRTVLRVPEPLDIEKYIREAGYGEAYNYAVL